MAKDKGKKYEPPPDPLENKRPKNTDNPKNEQPRSSDPRRKGF